MKKSIIFLPIHESSFNELLRIIEYLKIDGSVNPKILIANHIIRSKKDILAANNIDYIDLLKNVHDGGSRSNYGFISVLKNTIKKNRLAYRIAMALNSNEKKEAQISNLLQKRVVEIKKVLLETRPISVVVSGDRHPVNGWEPAILKVCREKNIPAVIPPISYTSNIEGLPGGRRNRKIYQADNFPEVKAKYPKQYIYDDISKSNIFFYPSYLTEALAKQDMLPENPWVMGGGHSTFVLADGEETRDRYINLGCNPNKIIITGHPSHDNLFMLYKDKTKLRNSLNQEYAFGPDKKLIILALPQLAEHGLVDWKSHWNEIRFLCKTLSQLHINSLISLHPKMEYEKYKFIEAEYNIPISKRPLANILPAADIFTATFSSTIQWSVLCHIPSIVLGFYGLDYTMYNFLDGVKVIRRKEDLKTALDTLIQNDKYYYQMSKKQAEKASYISPFDGRCMERIVDVLLYPNK